MSIEVADVASTAGLHHQQQETPVMRCVLFALEEPAIIHREPGRPPIEAERVTVSEGRRVEGCGGGRVLTLTFVRKGRRQEEHAFFTADGPTHARISPVRASVVAFDTRDPDSVYSIAQEVAR